VTYVTTGERIGFEQGIQQGLQQGELTIVLRQLTRRIGGIAPNLEVQIRMLSLTQVETLGEALLDFSQPSDLDDWLKLHA
jgi:predicted transposase YdaD